ncbi:alpha/beta fold hydrolase [Pelomonas sp. KK5]|uniref:alpha/beta hydrolase n=1 Tax=Pelomonas sp. KK5 TaxID=1855730 RepID=UPI00097C7E3A|nr:alpha/beta hydrolase [Pelomonas sp. KK5]
MDRDLKDMFVTRWGSEDAPRVVLVHGSAQGSEVGGDKHFAAQRKLAARGWQLLVPDRPGHGRSPDPGRPDDADADGALVAGLLGEGAHLVGHSFGACVALAAAAQRPEAVRSLTIIEPAMAAMAIGKPGVLPFVLRMVGILLFSLSPQSRIRRFVRLVNIPPEIRGGSSPEELQRMGVAIRKLKLPSKPELLRQWEIVRRAGIPVWVVSGGWCPAFEAISDEAAAQAGGRRTVIPSPHHFPQQVSEQFNNELAVFMATRENMRSD